MLLTDFQQEQPQKPQRDYSWIAPTAVGVGMLAALGVGIAAGHKGVKAKNLAEAEKAVKKTKPALTPVPIVTLDDIQPKPLKSTKPVKPSKPTLEKKTEPQPQPTIEKKVVQKSDAKPMPKGLKPIEKTIEIKRRKLKLKNNPATVQEVYQYTRQGGQNIAPSKRSALTQADIERRQDAVNKMISANSGDYSGLYLLCDFAYKDPDWMKVLNKWGAKTSQTLENELNPVNEDRLDIINRLRGVANKAKYENKKPKLEFLKKKYIDPKTGKERRVTTGITSIYRKSPRLVDVDLLVGNPASFDDNKFKGALDSLDKKVGKRKVIIQGINEDVQKLYKKKFGDRMP